MTVIARCDKPIAIATHTHALHLREEKNKNTKKKPIKIFNYETSKFKSRFLSRSKKRKLPSIPVHMDPCIGTNVRKRERDEWISNTKSHNEFYIRINLTHLSNRLKWFVRFVFLLFALCLVDEISLFRLSLAWKKNSTTNQMTKTDGWKQW